MIERHNKVGGQKLYNLFGRFNLLIIISALFTLLSASSFENFRQSNLDTHNINLDEKEMLFSSYLKSEWEGYVSEGVLSLYEKSKPNEISPARYTKSTNIGPKVNIYIEKSKEVKPLNDENPMQKKEIEFDFFGTKLGFNIPSEVNKANFYPQNQKGINNFFNIISLSEYELLTDYITQVSTQLNLNDWGKYLLIKNISQKIFSNQNNSQLFSWFIFNKLGYAVKVGLSGNRITILYQSDKEIYLTPYYKIDGKNYYAISDYAKNSTNKVFTYKQDYPDLTKVFDLSIDKLPTFKENLKLKTLSFSQYGKEYKISYNYNKNLIDFMSTYPQADCKIFFNTPMDKKTYKDIATGLKKYIDTKRMSVALDFVLNFVQKAFKYEVDTKQFGREKMMFADETLYYDKSDSEDRAILFSYLVKELFNINVVGIKYKDHMATALYIPIDGDSVKIHSKKFIVADPTYINAIIGQSIPKYKSKKLEGVVDVIGK